MRKILTLTVLSFLLFSSVPKAQDFSNAGSYMDFITDKVTTAMQIHMNYLSALSHGKSARKVEKLRLKVLTGIDDAKFAIMGMPPYKGDRTLKDATIDYFKTCFIVFNEDYGKIVNMEEIAEQSYDAMEAYMLAQQKANEKLTAAGEKRVAAFNEFAKKNNITVIEADSELSKKIQQANRINKYYDSIYLIFFKNNKQDAYLTAAVNAGDINAVEQNKNALHNYAEEGLAQLENFPAFGSDASLKTACQKVLRFYKRMTETKVESISNYLLVKDNFEKIKKGFDQKSSSQRTQTDIDNYNKAVNEMNRGVNAYNSINNDINSERVNMLNLWNSTVKTFFDTYMPYAR